MKSTSKDLPPHSPEAELAILGNCLNYPEVINLCIEAGVEKKFFDLRHSLIFSCIAEIAKLGIEPDLMTLLNIIKEKKLEVRVGGFTYLQQLLECGDSGANTEYWIEILEDKFYARQIAIKGRELIDAAMDTGKNLRERAEAIEMEIMRLRAPKESETLTDQLDEVMDMIEQAQLTKGESVGLRSGYYDIDQAFGGMRAGQMIVLAARPGVGKSTLGLNILENLSIRNKIPTGFLSLEMPPSELLTRTLARFSGVPSNILTRGQLSSADLLAVGKARLLIDGSPLRVVFCGGKTIAEISALIRRMIAESETKCFVIDYLQLIHGTKKTDNKNSEVTEISNALKILAGVLKVPIIVLSQLNREIEKRSDPRPRLSDLRDSGSIEQDADKVLFMWNAENGESLEKTSTVKLSLDKNRNGPSGTVIHVTFFRELCKFESAARISQHDMPAMI